jgi:hypothetical protein
MPFLVWRAALADRLFRRASSGSEGAYLPCRSGQDRVSW